MDDGTDMAIPPLFRCPISLDLFKDPVTLCTGQTYDRSCIERWLSQGNSTCPVTMQRLDDPSMVPNHTVRHLIDSWLGFGGRSEPHCFEFGEADLSIVAARQILESDESALEHKVGALERVDALCQGLPLENYCLIKMDFFGVIWGLVFRVHLELDSRVVVEKALSCALKLMPFSDLRALNVLKVQSKFQGFLCLFEQGNVYIKKSLCLVVEAISSSLETQDLCKYLGQSAQLVQVIISFVNDKSEVAKAGISAASGLSTVEPNRENLVREGVVEGLIEYISHVEKQDQGSCTALAMSTIEKLLATEGAKEAIMGHPNGVRAIVRMVFRVSDHAGSESAVNALVSLCAESRAVRERAVLDGVLVQLLLLLQSQCSGRTKAKARMLLKLIKSRWNEDIH